MKINEQEKKRLYEIIYSKMRNKMYKEIEELETTEIRDTIKEAVIEFNLLKSTLIEFNYKYKTNLSIYLSRNNIKEDLLFQYKNKIEDKYDDLYGNIKSSINIEAEKNETYESFIEWLEKKYNLILK